jgi:hypothetical protein
MRNRWVVRAGLAAMTCVGALLIPTVASAAPIDVDYFTITANHVDFGNGNLGNISGRPTDDGQLDWNLVGGELEPRLIGKIFLNNTSGGCGRMQLTYNWSGADVTYSDSTWCAPNGQTWYANVDFAPFADASITSVTVRLQYKTSSGAAWTTAGSSTWIPS